MPLLKHILNPIRSAIVGRRELPNDTVQILTDAVDDDLDSEYYVLRVSYDWDHLDIDFTTELDRDRSRLNKLCEEIEEALGYVVRNSVYVLTP